MFQVVFRGQVAEGFTVAQVRERLAEQFRLSAERLDALFSGRPVVLKKGLDQAGAERLQTLFGKAGAVCEIREMAESQEAATPPASSAPPTESGADTAGHKTPVAAEAPKTEPASGATADEGSVQAAGIAGTEVADDPNETVVHLPIPEDLGGLELDPAERYVPPGEPEPVPEIDTSGLEVIDDSGPLQPRDEDAEPPAIDISGLDLTPPR